MLISLKKVCFIGLFTTLLCSEGKAQVLAPIVTGNTLVCYGDSTTLTASVIPNDTSVTYKWYDDPLGGILLHDGNPYTTGPITVAKTIYCESWKNGVRSLIRTPVVILEVLNVDVPTASVSPASFCPGDTVTLTGYSLTGSTQFNWYDDLLDPTPISTDNPFVTPLSGTTLFHLQSINAFGCRSVRAPVLVTVLPNLDVPLADADPTFICLGDTSEVEAYSLNGSSTFHWYEDALDPNPIFTGNPFYASPNSTETYFVSSETQFGCESIRTPVTVVVRRNLDIPTVTLSEDTICPGDTAYFHASSANGSNQFRWYNSLIGGTLLFTGATVAKVLHVVTTLFVETVDSNGCTSVRVPITVYVSPNIDVPTATYTPSMFCAGDTITALGVSPLGYTHFNWYNQNDSLNLLFTGNPYETTVNEPTTLLLSTLNDQGCESPKSPVAIIPSTNGDLVTATASSMVVCARDSVTFTASSTIGASVFNWYDAANGGNLIHSGPTFTSEITSDTTFYVESESVNGCRSTKTPVSVLITPNNDLATASASDYLVCPGESVQFTGSTSNGSSTLNWYTSMEGGQLIHTGQTMTQIIDSTTTYYLESTNTDGCGSLRMPVMVAVTPNLDVPLATASPMALCAGDSVQFTAQSTSGLSDFKWYTNPIGGAAFDSLQTITVEAENGVNYYVESQDPDGCRSLRIPVPVTIYPAPAIPTASASPSTICFGDTSVLTAQSITSNLTFQWYDAATAGNLLHVGNTYSVSPQTSAYFYVEGQTSNGCKTVRTSVQVSLSPMPTIQPSARLKIQYVWVKRCCFPDNLKMVRMPSIGSPNHLAERQSQMATRFSRC